MAREWIDISCTPSGEDCEQLGPNYDPVKAKAECKAFMGQLRRMFGEEPAGARLKIKANPHDFGTYQQVVCEYNDKNEEACEYAYKCEREMPEYWDEQAKIELGLV